MDISPAFSTLFFISFLISTISHNFMQNIEKMLLLRLNWNLTITSNNEKTKDVVKISIAVRVEITGKKLSYFGM